jgi:benzoate 4-monooxygenase
MRAVMNEALRIHSTSSLGLPRLIPFDHPKNGLEVLGVHYPPGTVLSVPTYTLHRLPEIWGSDSEIFRPERWLTEDKDDLAKMRSAFNPFSTGPRACVGRNVAEMELALIVAVTFRAFEWELYQDDLPTREGFLRKPLGLNVGVKRRM